MPLMLIFSKLILIKFISTIKIRKLINYKIITSLEESTGLSTANHEEELPTTIQEINEHFKLAKQCHVKQLACVRTTGSRRPKGSSHA